VLELHLHAAQPRFTRNKPVALLVRAHDFTRNDPGRLYIVLLGKLLELRAGLLRRSLKLEASVHPLCP
jgi:hypothetical protein